MSPNIAEHSIATAAFLNVLTLSTHIAQRYTLLHSTLVSYTRSLWRYKYRHSVWVIRVRIEHTT